MKTITIIGADKITTTGSLLNPQKDDLVIEGGEDISVSDGYHTFDELYEHRIILYLAFCRKMYEQLPFNEVWRSKLHSDGTIFDGWFVLGIYDKPGKQITYHLPIKYWSDTEFAETLDQAPVFDGHTSADVLERLKKL